MLNYTSCDALKLVLKEQKKKMVFWRPDHIPQWRFLVEVSNVVFHLMSYGINKGPHGAPLLTSTCTQTSFHAVFYFHTLIECTFGFEWFIIICVGIFKKL